MKAVFQAANAPTQNNSNSSSRRNSEPAESNHLLYSVANLTRLKYILWYGIGGRAVTCNKGI